MPFGVIAFTVMFVNQQHAPKKSATAATFVSAPLALALMVCFGLNSAAEAQPLPPNITAGMTTIFTASFEGPEWKDGTDSIVAGAARYFNKNYWRSYANAIDATYSQDYARTGETSLKHRMPLSGRYVSDAAGGIEGTLGFGGSFFDILVEPESTYQVTAWRLL